MARLTKVKEITKGVSKGLRSKLIKGNEELITLLLIYAILILWVLNFNT
jgi:hypothetical protein